jgi:hypothetical protein
VDDSSVAPAVGRVPLAVGRGGVARELVRGAAGVAGLDGADGWGLPVLPDHGPPMDGVALRALVFHDRTVNRIDMRTA